MVKRIGRRFVSLLLTFVTILTMLPAMTLPALAATESDLTGLADPNIGLHYSGDTDNSWSAQDMTISGKITGRTGTGGCAKSQSSTLTILNKSNKKAKLSFDYTIEFDEGSVVIANGSITKKNGNFNQILDENAWIEVQITSGEGENKTTTIEITNVNLETEQGLAVTFQPAKNGTYTVDGKAITEDRNYNRSSTSPYPVKAIPNEGYQFLGWYDVSNGTYLPGKANGDIYVSLNNSKVTAIFKEKGTTFQEESSNLKWDNLNDAIISASNNDSGQITLLKSCAISGEYTIPSGVTLLIPFDETGTLYAEKPGYVANYVTQKVFRKLTIAPGSSITVNGAISVGGQYSQQQGKQGPSGSYGQIDMAAGSTITLKNGANLYAWGYITGDGQITAENGATVYECFQLRDWRGGTASDSMKKNEKKVFPFSQYYVQNIEAPLTIQYGATEKAYFCVSVSKVNCETTIDFIGSNGLFKLESGGSITKRYIPKEGRTEYTTNGTAFLDRLFVEISVLFIHQDISSDDYALPINGNMTLNIASGKVTSNYDLCLLPGVQINIAKDAELEIASNASLYVYDSAEWGDYCQGDNKKIDDVFYSPSPDWHKRTEHDLVPAKIDVNGTLTAAGSVYTTSSGADICSSEGGGKYVQQSAPGSNTTTHQATQNDRNVSYADIPITPAQLKNAVGAPTLTAGSSAGDTFTYCTGSECGGGTWVPNLQVAAIIDSTGTQTPYPTLQDAVGAYEPDDNTAPKNYIKLLHSTTEAITADRNLYLDLNGYTVTGDFNMAGHTLYGMDSSANADYDTPPKGKIVGAVSGYARTCQSPTVKVNDVDTYDRYVAILGNEDTTQTLSFHHFNISVTGYRFELAAPKCALFFIGKFQGDEAAKNHLKSLGFTLTDIDAQSHDFSYQMPESLGNMVGSDDEGAYLFEAYLIQEDINKNNPNTYKGKFFATAKATFNHSGALDQDEENSRSSVKRDLSFEEAWTNATVLDETQKEILDKFLKALDIPNPKTE